MWDSDATLYPHLIRCNPEDLLARNNYAAWFARHNRHREAVHNYNALLEMHPQHPKAPLYRAISLSQIDASSTEVALSEFDKMLVMEPFRNDLRCHRAGTLRRLKRNSEAEAEYETVIFRRFVDTDSIARADEANMRADEEELGFAWMRYGTLRQEERRYSEAEHCFRQALRTKGPGASQTRAEAMINLATVLISSKEKRKDNMVLAEVEQLREKARQIAPDSPAVLMNVANGKVVMICVRSLYTK